MRGRNNTVMKLKLIFLTAFVALLLTSTLFAQQARPQDAPVASQTVSLLGLTGVQLPNGGQIVGIHAVGAEPNQTISVFYTDTGLPPVLPRDFRWVAVLAKGERPSALDGWKLSRIGCFDYFGVGTLKSINLCGWQYTPSAH
jgi:hypothetical protein